MFRRLIEAIRDFTAELKRHRHAMTAATEHLARALDTLAEAVANGTKQIADELALIRSQTDVSPEVDAAATRAEAMAATMNQAVADAKAALPQPPTEPTATT